MPLSLLHSGASDTDLSLTLALLNRSPNHNLPLNLNPLPTIVLALRLSQAKVTGQSQPVHSLRLDERWDLKVGFEDQGGLSSLGGFDRS